METAEQNVLIAKFDGWTTDYERLGPFYERGNLIDGYECIMPNDMRYHTSWDWLMLVVIKCKDAYVKYRREVTEVNTKELADIINDLKFYLTVDINILGLHKSVVHFIQWYNTNKIEKS